MGDFKIFNLSVSLGTMIYQALLFTILVFILKKFFLGKLVAVMEKRQNTIDEQLHLAEKCRVDSEKMLFEQQQATSRARREAKELILQSQKQADAILYDARKDAMKIRSQAYEDLKKRRGVNNHEKNIS
ncbi:ATP synthase F0 subunit B [Bacillus sp. REN3]|uniref:ATP synthase F0 subunit B n=1 Tax=Bacillus sp. REN3 TaxID=2802440 RepID=UPI001AEE0FAA|nr:ATP synthase F0 subunit B [Bacillus sp. REN3]